MSVVPKVMPSVFSPRT